MDVPDDGGRTMAHGEKSARVHTRSGVAGTCPASAGMRRAAGAAGFLEGWDDKKLCGGYPLHLKSNWGLSVGLG